MPLVVDRRPGLLLRVRVEDHDAAEPPRAQVREEPLRIREAHRVERERAVALLVVDVEPDHVRRDAALAKVVGDEADARLRVVAVAALVVAERPQRRQRHAAGERRVALDHLLRRRAVDEVVVELAAVGSEGHEPVRLVADVEARAVAVVEEDAMGAALAQHHVERHRGVDRIGGRVVAVGVAVPHYKGVAAELPAALVEAPDLLAEAVDVLVGPQALPDLEARARDRRAEVGVVLVERLAGRARDRHAERGMADRDAQRARGDRGLPRRGLEREGRIAELARDDGVGVVPTEGTGRREADAHHFRRQHAHRSNTLLAPEYERGALARGRRKRAERSPARERLRSERQQADQGRDSRPAMESHGTSSGSTMARAARAP